MTALGQAGREKLQSASCILKSEGLMVLSYAADIVMFSKYKSHINNVNQFLGKKFTLRDLRYSTHILGMEITLEDTSDIKMRHGNLIPKLLDQHCIGNAKPVKSPMQSDIDICVRMSVSSDRDSARYRSIVGSLKYLATKSRRDLCAVARSLDSHVKYPTETLMAAAKPALRQIKGKESTS